MQAAGGETLTAGPAHGHRARWLCAVLALVVVAGDLVAKQLALTHFADGDPLRLLGGAVYLTYATNSGAAFNIGGSVTWVFTLFAVVVLGWIAWWARRLRSHGWAVALGLVAGGAAGNLVDRLFRAPGPFVGEVVDMVSVFAPDGSVWPIFNIADSALVVGVVTAVWLEFTGRQRDGGRVHAAPAAHSTSAQAGGTARGGATVQEEGTAHDSAAAQEGVPERGGPTT